MNTLTAIMKYYVQLIQDYENYDQWLKDNPDKYYWENPHPRVSKTEVKRAGIIVRQLSVRVEDEM